jgi:hypothetical protein
LDTSRRFGGHGIDFVADPRWQRRLDRCGPMEAGLSIQVEGLFAPPLATEFERGA